MSPIAHRLPREPVFVIHSRRKELPTPKSGEFFGYYCSRNKLVVLDLLFREMEPLEYRR